MVCLVGGFVHLLAVVRRILLVDESRVFVVVDGVVGAARDDIAAAAVNARIVLGIGDARFDGVFGNGSRRIKARVGGRKLFARKGNGFRVSPRRRIGELLFRHFVGFEIGEGRISRIEIGVFLIHDGGGTVREREIETLVRFRFVFEKEEALLPAVVNILDRFAVVFEIVDVHRRDGSGVERGKGSFIGAFRFVDRDGSAREAAHIRRFQPEGNHQVGIGRECERVVFQRGGVGRAVRAQKHQDFGVRIPERILLKVVAHDFLRVLIG